MDTSRRVLAHEAQHLLRVIRGCFLYFFLPLLVVLAAIHFPYDTDASGATPRSATNFYEAAYRPTSRPQQGVDYEETAARVAEAKNVEGQIRQFVSDYRLQDKRVLDVGSGRGYLQDMVTDYTGLDLSSKVAPYYHKPFVVGSATAMPFADNSFDAAWTVWVIEHIPEPEKAFRELRRVIKPGGVLFLMVAWQATPWAADGFSVRPYGDFNVLGKLVKASIPLRNNVVFDEAHRIPVRLIRWMQYSVGGRETSLHFRALQPNYDVYWQPDSDAAVSLDDFEAMLWFESRGDSCLNCRGTLNELVTYTNPLIIRIDKK